MWILISTLHIMASLLLIALILMQQGKGADAGASFGGDSSSVFGPMVENPLKNVTTIVAFFFMATSVSLAYNQRYANDDEGHLFSREAVTTEAAAPIGTTETPTAPVAAENPNGEAQKNVDSAVTK